MQITSAALATHASRSSRDPAARIRPLLDHESTNIRRALELVVRDVDILRVLLEHGELRGEVLGGRQRDLLAAVPPGQVHEAEVGPVAPLLAFRGPRPIKRALEAHERQLGGAGPEVVVEEDEGLARVEQPALLQVAVDQLDGLLVVDARELARSPCELATRRPVRSP